MNTIHKSAAFAMAAMLAIVFVPGQADARCYGELENGAGSSGYGVAQEGTSVTVQTDTGWNPRYTTVTVTCSEVEVHWPYSCHVWVTPEESPSGRTAGIERVGPGSEVAVFYDDRSYKWVAVAGC